MDWSDISTAFGPFLPRDFQLPDPSLVYPQPDFMNPSEVAGAAKPQPGTPPVAAETLEPEAPKPPPLQTGLPPVQGLGESPYTGRPRPDLALDAAAAPPTVPLSRVGGNEGDLAAAAGTPAPRESTVGAALTGQSPITGPVPLPRPRPNLMMDASGAPLGAPAGPTSLGGPQGPTPLGGARAPLDITSAAQKAGVDEAAQGAKLAQSLRGVTMPKPPEVQKIATPNAPRPVGTIKAGELQALLQALNAAPGAAGLKYPTTLGGAIGR